MPKNLRLPLFGLLAIAVLGLLALLVFSGGEDEQDAGQTSAESDGPAANTPQRPNRSNPFNVNDATNGQAQAAARQQSESEPEEQEKEQTESQPAGTPDQPQVIEYEIEPGDMVSKIAVKFGCKPGDIYDLNAEVSSENAHKIRVGQKIKVLDKKGVGSNVAGSSSQPYTPGASQSESVSREPEPEPVEQPKQPTFIEKSEHALKPGDNYFLLAKKYYGSPEFWTLIRDANPEWGGLDFESGQTIVIPAIGGDEKEASDTVEGDAGNPIPGMKRN